jgi:spore maturation protein CgeB
MDDRHLRAALGYPRFRGPSVRALVLDSGYLVVGDVLDAAEDSGWEVAAVPVPRTGVGHATFLVDLLSGIAAHRPDFLITINHLGFDEKGELARLLDRYGVATASWFVDHPRPIVGGAPGNATPHCQVFCFERTALPWLASQGYPSPVYLPTASNRRYFHPDRVDLGAAAQLAQPLAFAGNSFWTKAREEPAAWARRASRAYCRTHRVDRAAVADGLWESLALVETPGPRGLYELAQTVISEATVKTRGRFARALSPLGLRVYGDPYWRPLAPGLDLVPFLDYKSELPALFAGCEVNANVTAEQMPTAVNQRVWDVPATGGFLLTDAQEDALEHFREGEEIAVYRSFEEAADRVRHYSAHPEERRAVASRAFARVEAEHRFTHRLARIAEVMRARFG